MEKTPDADLLREMIGFAAERLMELEVSAAADAGYGEKSPMGFPKEHRVKLHGINPIERLNGKIKRRADVVGIFPNDDVIVRLVGALLLE